MVYEIPAQYKRTFPKDEINAMRIEKWEGPIHIVRTEKQAKAACKVLELETLLGFDTETRPIFKKGRRPDPPCLLQLATEEEAYVFQIGIQPMTDDVLAILSDPDIIKTGVAVRDDVLGLQKLAEFRPAGFLDLADYSLKHGMQTHGLRNLAANLLGFRISKGAQCSNWARENLSPQQVNYAATDAWVSRELYLAMAHLEMFIE